jgi:hypothetical protein
MQVPDKSSKSKLQSSLGGDSTIEQSKELIEWLELASQSALLFSSRHV